METTDITTVGQLSAFLLSMFPATDAEPWDNVGLLQGDARTHLKGVAIALNATPNTVEASAQEGCNVLVSHHPAFLGERPALPTRDAHGLDLSIAQRTLAKAQELGVAIIALHTNLDVSDEAIRLPGHLTGYDFIDRLVDPAEQECSRSSKTFQHRFAAIKAFVKEIPGYFMQAFVRSSSSASSNALSVPTHSSFANIRHAQGFLRGCYGGIFSSSDDSVEKIAETFAEGFHCHAQILSASTLSVTKHNPVSMAFCSGSLDKTLGIAALKRGVDLIVCGEVHYHTALDLVLAGATLIELGHDASEEPYVPFLHELMSSVLPNHKIVSIEGRPLLMSVK